MITNIIKQDIIRKQEEGTEAYLARKRAYSEPKLNASDVGHCPRKAFWSALKAWPEHPLHVDETHPFGFYVQSVMNSGNVWERELAAALVEAGGTPNYEIITKNWGGEIDVLLRQNGTWRIIELKDTSEHNFKISRRLPYKFHCIQALTYQRLLIEHEELDVADVEARLYYNGRGHSAEFVVWRTDGYVVYEGHIDGKVRTSEFEFDLEQEMDELEVYWEKQEVPPAYPTPFYKKFGECIRGSKTKGYWPGCIFWGHCWKAENGWPQEGPFSEGECPD